MALDTAKNFAKVTLNQGYDAAATSLVLSAGHGLKLPTVPFNATWWNSTDYADPSDDPNVEVVRVTLISTDTLTVTRAQESTAATVKNLSAKTYKMRAGLTAKVINTDLPTVYVRRLLTEFYSDRYSVLPNVECTPEVQAVIDEMAAGPGGELIFMEAEPYLFNGALQDGARRNAQLLLPSIAITDTQKTIGFRGAIVPAFSPSGSTDTPLPKATILQSTLASGSGTQPAFIGGRGPVGGVFDEASYVHAEFSDLVVRLPANPSFSGINLQRIGNIRTKDLLIVAGAKLSTPQITQPTTTTSYGMIMPQFNNGILQEAQGELNIVGFYNGIRLGELAHLYNLWVQNCILGMEVPFSYHASLIQRMIVFWCPTGIKWLDDHCVDILQLDIERAAGSQWYSPVAELSDIGNLGSGELRWLTVLAGVGRVHSFTKIGGDDIITREVGALYADGREPMFTQGEVGNINASTVIVTFDQTIKASNYLSGAIIKVNTVPATINSGVRETDKTKVRYVLSVAVDGIDAVTYAYNAIDGFIENEMGIQVPDVADTPLTNNVAPGSTVLQDTFTDTNGVNVTAHTMNIGPGWTKIEGGANEVKIQTNKAATTLDAAVAYAYYAESGAADVEVSADIVFGTFGTAALHYCSLIVRASDANNYLKFLIFNGASNNMQIIKVIGGADTVIAQTTIVLNAGQTYAFDVVVSGNNLSFTVDGTVLPATDAFNAANTIHGFRFYQGAANVSTIDNFLVTA